MSKSRPKTPPVPDPVESIEAQARVNRMDTYTPFGSTVYTALPGEDGRYQVDFEFSDPVEDLWQRTYGMVSDGLGTDNEYSDLTFGQASKYIQEGFDPQIESFQEEMANRGIPEGSELYDEQYKLRIGDPMQRAYDDAAYRAIAAGDTRRLQEYNMLSNIWGRGTVAPTTPIDALTPYQMQQNALNRNYQADLQRYNAQMQAASNVGAAAVGKK